MKTTLHVHPAFVIDEVDPRIFGGFLEHHGRAVYEGVTVVQNTDWPIRDKSQITVKLQAHPGNYAGGLFGSRIVRAP